MIISQDFKEFIELLNTHNVQYLVIGGYAVAFHGHPRYTKDIDIWINRTGANAENLLRVLEDFGFGTLGLTIEDFLRPGYIIQLGYPPNRIDLLTSLKGVDFDTCYASKVDDIIDGVCLHFIDVEHLKISKRIAGRHQDLADVENLTE
jgi:hypothetical protein